MQGVSRNPTAATGKLFSDTQAEESEDGSIHAVLQLHSLSFRVARIERAYRFFLASAWFGVKALLMWATFGFVEAVAFSEVVAECCGNQDLGINLSSAALTGHGAGVFFAVVLLLKLGVGGLPDTAARRLVLCGTVLPNFAAAVLNAGAYHHLLVGRSPLALGVLGLYQAMLGMLSSLTFVPFVAWSAAFTTVYTVCVLAAPAGSVGEPLGGVNAHDVGDSDVAASGVALHHVWILNVGIAIVTYALHLTDRLMFFKLRASQVHHDNLASVMQAVVDPLIGVNATGGVEASNMAAAQLLGCTQTQLLHLDLDDLLVHGHRKGERMSFAILVQRLHAAVEGGTGSEEGAGALKSPEGGAAARTTPFFGAAAASARDGRKGQFLESKRAAVEPAEDATARLSGLQGQRVTVRHRDGTQIPMSLSFGRGDGSGKPFYIVCLHDMREYDTQKKELERASVEREVLQRSNRTRREFLRYIFHEVRVPFNALSVGIETVINDMSEPGQLKTEREMENLDALFIMQEQATAMSRILDDVLSMQKIEEARFDLELKPVSLRHVVFGVVRTFSQACLNRQIKLVMESDECPPLKVVADMPRLQQVISNLTSNALKFTPEHGTITVRAVLLSSETERAKKAEEQRAQAKLAPRRLTDELSAMPHTTPDSVARRKLNPKRLPSLEPKLSNVSDHSGSDIGAGAGKGLVVGASFPLPPVGMLRGESSSGASLVSPRSGTGFGGETVTPSMVGEGASPHPLGVSSTHSPMVGNAPAGAGTIDSPSSKKGLSTLVPSLSNGLTINTGVGDPKDPFGISTVSTPRVDSIARIRISVSDTGVGISAEDRKRLFIPYVQISAGELQKGKGTGLGLSIAKHIVERHGGKMGCDSEPGKGSTFWLEIPFVVAGKESAGVFSTRNSRVPLSTRNRARYGTAMDTAAGAGKASTPDVSAAAGSDTSVSAPSARSPVGRKGSATRSPLDAVLRESEGGDSKSSPLSRSVAPGRSGPSATPPTGTSRSRHNSHVSMTSESLGPVPPVVLLVEDSVANQKLMARLLRQMGYGCDVADNGQVCLDKILPAVEAGKPCPYPLILMDREMPTMNGHEATRRLRAAGIEVPIIAVTGNALKEDRDAFLDAGATDVLTKPVRMAQLRTVLAELMDGED